MLHENRAYFLSFFSNFSVLGMFYRQFFRVRIMIIIINRCLETINTHSNNFVELTMGHRNERYN